MLCEQVIELRDGEAEGLLKGGLPGDTGAAVFEEAYQAADSDAGCSGCEV